MGFNGNMLGGLFANRGYASKIKGLFGSSLIGYWKMDETIGSVSYDVSGQANNGAYTGVTLANTPAPTGAGGYAPLFDGANDYNDIYSAALNADFSGAAGTVLIWSKAYNSGVWSDGVLRNVFNIGVDTNNYVKVFKAAAANTVYIDYKAGGTSENVGLTSHSPTTWVQYGITWDKTANEMKGWYNGAQVNGTQTIAGTWAGNLGFNNVVIGSLTATPTSVWNGYLAHAMLLNRAATPTEILNTYQWGV